MMDQEFDVVVVGLGLNGLCTAYHLAKNPQLKILLLEQFDVGHTQGSSHSQIRIIRSAYRDPLYTELTLEAKNKYWPEMESTLGCKLVNSNPFIIFGGDEKVFSEYKTTVSKEGFEHLRIVSGENAGERFKELNLQQFQEVIEDTNAGVIEAEKTLSSIYSYLKQQPHVYIRPNTKLVAFTNTASHVELQIQQNGVAQVLASKKAIVTAGKWIKELVPSLSQLFSINEQFIAYLEFDAPLEQFSLIKYPCWTSSSEDKEFWSLPAFGTDWVKFGRHVNLMGKQEFSQGEKIKQIQEFASKIFKRPLKRIQRVEKCYYTSTADQDFVIDFLDPEKRVLIASACSGHAFKFGPVTGCILSQLIQNGQSSVQIFQNKIHQFSIDYQNLLRHKTHNH